MNVIDAWAQHPTARHTADSIFDSLRRWTKGGTPDLSELPVSVTLEAMDAGGVSQALISAWIEPRNVMISNDEVASFVAQSDGRLVGVGSVDIDREDYAFERDEAFDTHLDMLQFVDRAD